MNKIKEFFNAIPKPVKIGLAVLVAIALFATILLNGSADYTVNQ